MTRLVSIYRIAWLVFARIVMLVGASGALGQSESLYDTRPFHQPVSPLPVEYGFSQDHSSTAFEGAQRGRAAVIQALGNFRLAESQAAILFEQARGLDRENDLKQTLALQAQRDFFRETRELNRQQREARVAAGRVKLAARRASVYRAAYQLMPGDLNATTGEIRWPAVLQPARFEAERTAIGELFRVQVSYGDPQSGVAQEIGRRIKMLTRALQHEIASVPREEYVAAQKFLLGLKFAAEGIAQG